MAGQKMNPLLRALVLRVLFVYEFFWPIERPVEMWLWPRRGRPYPPPSRLKQQTVQAYGQRFALETLIETGTYLGEMAAVSARHFQRVVSIELDHDLYQRAHRKLSRYGNVTVLWGDSAWVLPQVLAEGREPYLFWLDAHYSGGLTASGVEETPIARELELILGQSDRYHVVLIDDARCYDGRHGYPRLADLCRHLSAQRPSWLCEVRDDIIRFHPRDWPGLSRPSARPSIAP